VKRLAGRADDRLRVGDWRVIFEVEADVVLVTAIASRGDVFKR
jgi:mRNA-degrading endonuclease RelE of RelBE toxin-antitoxin system